MATPVREYLLNADDSVNVENLTKLRNATKDKTCSILTKNKRTCGRAYNIFPRHCGCRFHEDYSHALVALNVLDNE